MKRCAAVALVMAATAALGGPPSAAEPLGRTTLDETIGLAHAGGMLVPVRRPGARFAVRTPGHVAARAGRANRRRSLVFFAQLTDAQLADEMSPARLEFVRPGTPFLGLWRPNEALGPQTFDQTVRNVNANAVSRVPDGAGRRARLQFSIVTGDLSDNHQRNEVAWGVRLLEGGRIDPFSGARIGPGNRCPGAPRRVVRRLNAAVEARRYTGVQDYDDWRGGPRGAFYDPDAPRGAFTALPRYPGLLERAQRPFRAAGLAMPWYSTRGNHDAFAQGFVGARRSSAIATGCRKVMPLRRPPFTGRVLDGWESMLRLLARGRFRWVPPDPRRRFVSPQTFKRLHGRADRGHGFRLVSPRERRHSRGAASYYAWSPRRGLRFVALDTIADGGGSTGNLDHLQYLWLRRELVRARRRNQLVVAFGHHPLETMRNPRPDEAAGACGRARVGCDSDPRRSTPIHLGDRGRRSVRALFLRFPNLVLFVTGHVHHHRVFPHFRRGGSGFWQITTASHMSFPQHTRQIELMDNRDGTLSIFGTVLDTAAPVGVPASGTPAAWIGGGRLGSISRLLAANVRGAPQAPAAAAAGGTPAATAAGATPAAARPTPAANVELLVRDPRRGR
jgi:3',5'-cyclic AMP phosphodiesterase CpdA